MRSMRTATLAIAGAAVLAGAAAVVAAALAGPERSGVLVGQGALGDWTTDAPGVRRRITVADLPPPYATKSVDAGPRGISRPKGAWRMM